MIKKQSLKFDELLQQHKKILRQSSQLKDQQHSKESPLPLPKHVNHHPQFYIPFPKDF